MAPPAGKKAADAREREQQGLNEPTRYKVAGDAEVLGHGPGSVFEAYIEEDQEGALLKAGVLTKSNAELKEVPAPPTPAARAAALEHTPQTAKAAAELTQQALTVEGEPIEGDATADASTPNPPTS